MSVCSTPLRFGLVFVLVWPSYANLASIDIPSHSVFLSVSGTQRSAKPETMAELRVMV